MTDRLTIRALGGLTIERGGQRLAGFASRKVEALLVYLAYTGRALPREVLAELLWEERSQAQALSNLRVALTSLRQLAAPYVTITRQDVSINRDSLLWFDALELETLLDQTDAASLNEAARLYQGDFLAGFYVDSRAFEEWMLLLRERLRFRVIDALAYLVTVYAEAGNLMAAIAHATHSLQLDPYREDTYRQLMFILAKSGQRGAALAQYEACRRMLDEELGVQPTAETTALYDQIRSGELIPVEGHDRPLPVFGRYQIKALIGRGGMSEVFRGVDTVSQEAVAIKVLRNDVLSTGHEWIERFRREEEALRQLDHPNIVKMITAFEEGNSQYLVMEFASGGSLQTMLDEQGALPLDRVLHLALDLADALTHAHRLGIIHRDLKPANVLLDADGSVRLTDFGIAELLGKPHITSTHIVMGTLAYLSPESLNNDEADSRTDIWAFGVLLFEMLSGKHPFDESTISGTMAAILNKPVPDLESLRPDAPIALIDLIYRMLEKERFARISSVRLIGAELEAILQDLNGEPRRRAKNPSVLSTYVPIRDVPKYPLYSPLTAFVGRENELTELNRLLDDESVRLITIHGPGGMGKTRLALELAARQRGRFANGVYFVPLAIVNEEDSIVAAVASAINYSLPPIGDNKEGLLSFLHTRKSMLLVMDNLEQVGDGALLISEILNAAPAVKVLTTSREKLNLSGEIIFKLGGMEIPGREALEEAVEYDAIKLFIQSARRAQLDFRLQPRDLPHVLRICRRVQGMPLGIVLAAAWVEILSLEEIAEEIDQSLDFLEADIRDMPERHRSIRAIFESTWEQLSETERSVYMKLAIFRGGVKRQIAQYVTGATLGTLTSLVNKSLLWRDPDSARYEVHELLRQYAEEKLEQAGEDQMARDIHSHCYLSFLCQRDSDLRGFRQLAAMKEIESDFENVRAAWTWRVRKQDHEMIDMSLESLFLFCSIQGFFEPGEELVKQALIQFSPQEGEEPSLLWARLLMRRELLLDPHPDVQAQVERGLMVARRYEDESEIAFGLRALGYALSSKGDFAGAIPILEESLMHYRALHDRFNTERVLSDLGLFCGVLGDRERSLAYFQEALTIQREIGDDVGITHLVIRNGINVAAGDRFKPISKIPDI